jgi:hypothetical protein
MLQTSARLLRLLSRLQARRDWSGPELAERLGVSTRTHAPAALIAGRLPPAVLVEAVDEHTCIVNVGSDTPRCSPSTWGRSTSTSRLSSPPSSSSSSGHWPTATAARS